MIHQTLKLKKTLSHWALEYCFIFLPRFPSHKKYVYTDGRGSGIWILLCICRWLNLEKNLSQAEQTKGISHVCVLVTLQVIRFREILVTQGQGYCFSQVWFLMWILKWCDSEKDTVHLEPLVDWSLGRSYSVMTGWRTLYTLNRSKKSHHYVSICVSSGYQSQKILYHTGDKDKVSLRYELSYESLNDETSRRFWYTWRL